MQSVTASPTCDPKTPGGSSNPSCRRLSCVELVPGKKGLELIPQFATGPPSLLNPEPCKTASPKDSWVSEPFGQKPSGGKILHPNPP